MKPRNLKIYAQADFQTADRLDRIHMAMMEPDRFLLNEQEEAYFRSLQQAYQGCFDVLAQSTAILYIQENVAGCESWYKANRVYQDMCALFGRFVRKNKELQRQIAVEKLYYYAKKAEEDENWELAAKIIKNAAELEGLMIKEVQFINPDDLIIPEIEITSDPVAFIEAQTQDLDYEEVPDEEDGEDED